ncbi:ankyrin repeat-containing domain protein [Mycena metata]|uniref:Ankyrin repeat-containing domain protein n=1 Tax=Mycena metata TaxID=1033252 RepID=A0AAD7MRK2_9AGAR|nr:ankyrin repeat-containing domain protein [Mycena metata]
MDDPPCNLSNPDITGVGIRIAIYVQNLLCFAPVLVYLVDGRISGDELKGVKDQSIAMLAIAFAILISTIVEATGAGGNPTINSYHAAIVLDLSWMNNTSTWIWFILYVHHRTKTDTEPTPASWTAWYNIICAPLVQLLTGRDRKTTSSVSRSDDFDFEDLKSTAPPAWARWVPAYRIAKHVWQFAAAEIVLTLGSIHLSLMAGIGIWLWLDHGRFGASINCDPSLTVIGWSPHLSSQPLRIVSLTMYFLLLVPGFNLVPPFIFFLALHIGYNKLRAFLRRQPTSSTAKSPRPSGHAAFLIAGLACLVLINILFILDIEKTLGHNKHFQTNSQDNEWGFGQVLALLLLVLPLRDAWNALQDVRINLLGAQEQFDRICRRECEATLPRLELQRLIDDGAIPAMASAGTGFVDLLQLAAWYGKVELVKFLLCEVRPAHMRLQPKTTGGYHGTALQAAVVKGNIEVVQLLLQNRADSNASEEHYAAMLHVAVGKGDLEIVRLLLQNKGDPNAYTSESGTLLQAATAKGNIEIVRFLLESGADPNISGWRAPALRIAAEKQNVELVQLLLENGADPTALKRAHRSLLKAATVEGDPEVLRLFLQNTANPNIPALHSAAMWGSVDDVRLLLQSGVDPNMYGGRLGTALQAAAVGGSLEVVTLLLQNGADLKIPGGHYGTVLQAAAVGGNFKLLTLLLENGADPNVAGGHYGTALQAAAVRGSLAAVRLLLGKGVNPNIPGGHYETALQAAAVSGKVEVLRLLLQNGADPNIRGGAYGSALQAATVGGNLTAVRLLLENGANPNVPAQGCTSVLHDAVQRSNIELIHLLLRHGADSNTVGGHYGTALQAAAERGNLEVLQLLLQNGADPNIRGGAYGSALQAATAKGNLQAVQLLHDNGAGHTLSPDV